MNTIYILIILVVGYHDSNSQIAVEFNSKEACVAAGEWWRNNAKYEHNEFGNMHVLAGCFAKGEKK